MFDDVCCLGRMFRDNVRLVQENGFDVQDAHDHQKGGEVIQVILMMGEKI